METKATKATKATITATTSKEFFAQKQKEWDAAEREYILSDGTYFGDFAMIFHDGDLKTVIGEKHKEFLMEVMDSSDEDFWSDFEYNFELNPATYSVLFFKEISARPEVEEYFATNDSSVHHEIVEQYNRDYFCELNEKLQELDDKFDEDGGEEAEEQAGQELASIVEEYFTDSNLAFDYFFANKYHYLCVLQPAESRSLEKQYAKNSLA